MRHYSTVVFDIGNGFLKLIFPDGTIKVADSSIAKITDRSRFKNARIIQYAGGHSPNVSLGDMWIAGSDARLFSGQTARRIGDWPDSKGKALQGLQALAGVLDATDITIDRLVVSCPDPDVQGASIKGALQGFHRFQSGKSDYQLIVGECLVKPEGLGAAAYAIHTGQTKGKGLIAGLDCGFQTMILSGYTPDGREIESLRHVAQSGAKSLYQRIADDLSFRRAIGHSPRLDLIEDGIESKTFDYDGFRFEAIYRANHSPWLQESFQPMYEKLKSESDAVTTIALYGGGSELLRPLLTVSPKFVLLNNSQLASAFGLGMIAGIPIGQPIAA